MHQHTEDQPIGSKRRKKYLIAEYRLMQYISKDDKDYYKWVESRTRREIKKASRERRNI